MKARRAIPAPRKCDANSLSVRAMNGGRIDSIKERVRGEAGLFRLGLLTVRVLAFAFRHVTELVWEITSKGENIGKIEIVRYRGVYTEAREGLVFSPVYI